MKIASRLRRNLAYQDLLILAFHLYMCSRVYAAPDGPDAHTARIAMAGLLTMTVAVLLATRGELMAAGFWRSLTYRVGLFLPMVSSYFALRWCLAALQVPHLDADLYGIDRLLFGDSPAVLLDAFVTPSRVEWFAFFYYGYFFIIAVYLLGTLIFDSGQRAYELLFGSAVVVAAGHSLYTIVPGIGPHEFCAAMFKHPLVGGIWWHRVESAVQSDGAMLDVFPSLHTALPLLMVLHSFRHRDRAPFKQTWFLLGLVVINIIIATVFLRWHYGIDLIAGAALAAFAQRAAVWAWKREGQHACVPERQVVWERLAPSHMQTRDFNFIAAVFLLHMTMIIAAAVATFDARANAAQGAQPAPAALNFDLTGWRHVFMHERRATPPTQTHHPYF